MARKLQLTGGSVFGSPDPTKVKDLVDAYLVENPPLFTDDDKTEMIAAVVAELPRYDGAMTNVYNGEVEVEE